MRIAYVGNFKPDHSTENDIRRALGNLGHEVTKLQEDEIEWRQLGELVDGHAFMLWTRTWALEHKAQLQGMAQVRAIGIPMVGYHLDRWWGLARENQVTAEPFFRVDVLCTADGGHQEQYQNAGVDHRWFPPAVLAANCFGGQYNQKFDGEVGFVGNWRNRYHPEWRYRRELIDWLQRTYRNRLRLWPIDEQVRGRDLADLYLSCRVLVGDSCLAGNATRYWSDRIPETLGRGGYLIHPWVEGMEQHFLLGQHFQTYDLGDFTHLQNVIEYSLEHPEHRDRIARAGRAHVLAHHTYETRMGQIISLLETEGRFNRTMTGTRRVQVGDRSHYLDVHEGDGVVLDEIYRENVYQVHPTEVEGQTVIDVGGHIGAFTTWAVLAGAKQVITLEPDPDKLPQLRANVAGLPGVTVLEYALAEGETRQENWTPSRLTGTGGAHLDPNGEAVVSTITLDEVLRIANDRVAFLKIDIEGGEYGIDWNQKRLSQIQRIAMEFHGSHTHTAERSPDWERMVGQLASWGTVTTLGSPGKGGMIYWRTY